VTKSDVLVVVPTFNEAENIADALRRIHEAEPNVHVLVVDDGSPDGTAEIVRSLAESDDRVSLLERPGPRGLGPAYLAGFARGMREGYGLLVEMDADGSHPAGALPALIGAVRDSNEVGGAIGSRWVKGGAVVNWPRSREMISRCGSTYARVMLGLKVKDVTAGYRVYRSSALRSIDLGHVQSQGYCFQIDLTRRMIDAGYQLVEVPITFTDRVHGVSKMSKTIVLEAMWRVSIWGLARLFRWNGTRGRDSGHLHEEGN
jgi:dolichol-phosphate mannosyltransferase